MFKAEIIADSKNEFGNRITTFIVTFPRIILSEFNTHRVLSRNSASSRAIPFEKMLKSVDENPFVPIKWMKDHKGMQGNEYFCEEEGRKLEHEWKISRRIAMNQAEILSKSGVTKQFCNRLLEPFMWHTVIVTATEWENFFALRANEAAEIHMQKLSYMMLEEYNKSEPKLLKVGEWHIPFYNEEKDLFDVRVSVARCARVSYTTVGEESKLCDSKKDIELHDKLLSMGHMSPFEHCAKAMDELSIIYGWSGNFKGFFQYRKLIEGENKTDARVIKK